MSSKARKAEDMKITEEHFDHMKTEINKYVESVGGWDVLVKKYERGDFERSDSVRDLQCRFCWDVSCAAKLHRFYCEQAYKYADDSHILTALRKICPTVNRKY
ncbi:MAG: hypothetical protein M0P12_03100 [Paludibacteraceae bacterium]|nr:hypothetical protein [Paludibacteraceae bacterium]